MQLLRLGGNLPLQSMNLLGMLRAMFVKLVLQTLLFREQLLDLALQSMHTVWQIILFHRRLHFGQHSILDSVFNLLQAFLWAGRYMARLVCSPRVMEGPGVRFSFTPLLLTTQR